jgi:hypothetical protein
MHRSLSRTPVGIRFGDYVFSPPLPISRFSLPARATGLYVLLMPDPSWGPWHFQPLYFGEFGPQRDAHMSMAQQTCCLKIAAGRSLYFALYALPHVHGWAISQIKKDLIDRYRPLSNLESISEPTGLAQKLNTLESKIAEQEAILKLALAAIGQMVQVQQTEPRKRITGFLPGPADSRRDSSEKGWAIPGS